MYYPEHQEQELSDPFGGELLIGRDDTANFMQAWGLTDGVIQFNGEDGAATLTGAAMTVSTSTININTGTAVIESGMTVSSGTVNVELVDLFEPAVGDSFQIIRDLFAGGGVDGTFASTHLPPLAAGSVWDIVYNPTNGQWQYLLERQHGHGSKRPYRPGLQPEAAAVARWIPLTAELQQRSLSYSCHFQFS